MRCRWPAALVALLAVAHASDPPVVHADDIEAEDLRPGLIAAFADPDGTTVRRLDPVPALALAAAEAAHPRLSAAGGTARWDGYLNILRAGPYTFGATLRGKVRVTVGGKVVLDAEEAGDKAARKAGDAVELKSGPQPVAVEFTRLPGPARLELLWSAPFLRREPIPLGSFGRLPDKDPKAVAEDTRADLGRLLVEEHACASCHKPAAGDRHGATIRPRVAPDLSQVGKRAFPGWIARWLADPKAMRPATVMPKVFTDDAVGATERYAVARYLSQLGGPLTPEPNPPKPADAKKVAEKGQKLFASAGCVACHGEAAKDESPALFHLDAPNRYPLGNLATKTRPDRLAEFLSNPLAVNPSGRMPSLNLQGTEAADLARFLCVEAASESTDLPSEPAAEARGSVADGLVADREREGFDRMPTGQQWDELGKRLLTARGCVNCHKMTLPGNVALPEKTPATALGLLGKAADKGCVSGEGNGVPKFGLGAKEKEAVTAFLRTGLSGAGSPASAYDSRVALRRFNCVNCHARDGDGGLSQALVDQLRKYETPENAETVAPPPLTGVGHKLLTPWLKDVLVRSGRSRPWMGMRMPQFGEANVGFLADGLAALDGTEPDSTVHAAPQTAARLTAGRQLTGKSGFSCVSCHDIAGTPNTGTRGPDLAGTTGRVRYEWYRRWLEQPQRMVPNTRMPAVFSEGKSILPEILGGRADDQADAMWAYYALGPTMPLPDGLEPPKGLLVSVKDRPEVLRTFMPDVGTRSIAVGYPGGVSAAFDAGNCRLAYGWVGNFLDMKPVWDGRGGGVAKVLGQRFWNAPPGPPWAITTGDDPPDFLARAKDPAYGGPLPEATMRTGPKAVHFEGYSVDTAGEPTFSYRIDAVPGSESSLAVKERSAGLKGGIATGLARRFSLEVPERHTAWLLAGEAAANSIALHDADGKPLDGWREKPPAAAGLLLVIPQDGRVAVWRVTDWPAGTRWETRTANGREQAVLRLPPGPGKPSLTLEVWALPRADAELLGGLPKK